MKIQNRFFVLEIFPDVGLFSLIPVETSFPLLRNASLAVCYTNRGKVMEKVDSLELSSPLQQVSGTPHGSLQHLAFSVRKTHSPLHLTLEYALPENHPFCLWRMGIKNVSVQPVFIDQIEMLAAGGGDADQGGVIFPSEKEPQLAFYSNGWQSWSYTGVYAAGDKTQYSRLGPFQVNQNTNLSTPLFHDPGHFSSDFFGLLGDRVSRRGLIAGFLSQKQHFGYVEAGLGHSNSLKICAQGDHTRLNPGAEMTTDWAVLGNFMLDDPHQLDSFLDAVARENDVAPDFGETPVGWCSWYQYDAKVTASDIRENLHMLRKLKPVLPLKKFQIDDGWQHAAGDWLSFRDTFPDGIAPLVEEVRKAGFQPGIWIAPFMVHPRSLLRRQHADWLLRTSSGRLAYAGFVWNTFNAALDLTNPHALQYVREVLRTAAHNWNIPYIKLDFLYAAALPAKYQDDTQTRAQVLHHALQVMKAAAGDKSLLLGCGLPLGSAIGNVSAMRIGADVLESWYPRYFGLQAIFRGEPHMPSARNSIQNILSRSFYHRKWWINDPDCLLVRPDSRLTLDEVQSLATAIGMTGGSVLLSDDLTRLPPARLRLVASLLPPIDQRPRMLDWFDSPTPSRLRLDLDNSTGSWQVLAFFNWADEARTFNLAPVDFGLPPGSYWVRSFWQSELHQVAAGNPLFSGELPAHASILMSLRPVDDRQSGYLGSNFHISQGLEVSRWLAGEDEISFTLGLGRDAQGMVDLNLPRQPRSICCKDQAVDWQEICPNAYRLNLKVAGSATIQVKY
jgi:alpha-galactosidase